MKLQYKPIAVQDECFIDKKEGIIVLVKTMAQGKKNKSYKVEVEAFPDRNYLEKYINDNNLTVLSSEQFMAKDVAKFVLASLKEGK